MDLGSEGRAEKCGEQGCIADAKQKNVEFWGKLSKGGLQFPLFCVIMSKIRQYKGGTLPCAPANFPEEETQTPASRFWSSGLFWRSSASFPPSSCPRLRGSSNGRGRRRRSRTAVCMPNSSRFISSTRRERANLATISSFRGIMPSAWKTAPSARRTTPRRTGSFFRRTESPSRAAIRRRAFLSSPIFPTN